MKWITANQLEQWAATPMAGNDLPGVVSDLIRASSRDINAIRFPSGGKGQVRGFDGHLVSSAAGLNVPEGHSYWEIGTDKEYRAKATREFKKRSKELTAEERANTTFVFMSPWTWDSSKPRNTIENWIAARAKEYTWKNIIYLDGVSLETWLQYCPAAAAWHARNTVMCAPQMGVRSTEEFWSWYTGQFRYQLTEEVLLCERQGESEKIVTGLLADAGAISFSGDSPDEVIAFAIAAIRKAKPEIRLFLEARTLVVDDVTAGTSLLTTAKLGFLLRNEAARSPNQFAERGPTLVPLGRQQRSGTAPALTRPSAYAMGLAMVTMGIPENEATVMARGCGSSLTVLMRRIPSGTCEQPAWMPHADVVLPAILAGAWDADNELDTGIAQALAEATEYVRYESRLRQFLGEADPPLEREGTVWKVRAPMDAFAHIGERIGPEHLGLLRVAMSKVFGHIEPPPDPKAIVRLERPATRYSEWLREGLATTLLLIAAWEKQAGLRLGSGAGQRFADELVESLPGLRTNHWLLASLRDELPLLAEAAPDPLLSALEHMLEGDATAIRPLLIEVEGFLAPVAYHTGLLWALETLAWDPAYFNRAVKILAGLAAIDPGGRIGNRPINGLREIFLLWNPNTNAPAKQRMAALDEICRDIPAVGWGLVRMLLPTRFGSSSPTARPRLREAGASERPPVTYQELWDNQSAVVRRAIRVTGRNASRWIELLSVTASFAPRDRAAALDALAAALEEMGEEERRPVWETVREEVRKHERFATAEWALPADELQPLRAIMERYAPSDPVLGVVCLFDTWMQDSYEDQDKAERRRVDGLRELLANHGLSAVLRVGLETKFPYQVAQVLATIGASREQIERLLVEAVRAQPTANFSTSLARFIVTLLATDGRWIGSHTRCALTVGMPRRWCISC